MLVVHHDYNIHMRTEGIEHHTEANPFRNSIRANLSPDVAGS